MRSLPLPSRPTTRLAVTLVASGAVIGSVLVVNHQDRATAPGQGPDSYKKAYAAAAASVRGAAPGAAHVDPPGTAPHNHDDPKTKNLISRSAPSAGSTDGAEAADTADPTTPAAARLHAAAAGAQRAERPVRLRTVPIDPAQPSVPTDRYNLFNACYGLRSTTTGRWLNGTSVTATSLADATPFYFKPTALGSYLLYGPDGTFLGTGTGDGAGAAAYQTAPGPAVNWTVSRTAKGVFRLTLPGAGHLAVRDGKAVVIGTATAATRFQPVRRSGCAAFPEITTNVVGRPAAGVSGFQEARGYIDAHTHGMAFEFLGGDLHCGRPWSPWGVTVALKGCEDDGVNSLTQPVVAGFLSGDYDADPVGWPTFKSWPSPHALTHEGTYYKWMERSWLAGQRILVNLLVENNQLCTLYPAKHNSCDDMDSIRLQAKDMRLMQDYIDAQHGGPGKGWYRLVRTPVEARQVINAGKLAVITGIETSVIFGCHLHLGQPTCTQESIDRQLDEVQRLGAVQLELVNKFDNALAGVAGDSGTTGYLVNAANVLETGSPWRMTTCDPNDPEVHDKDQDNSAEIPSQDALFGAVLKALPGSILAPLLNVIPAIPLYPAKHHCNTVGLSDLGAYTIAGMVKRKMLLDPDHMSVKARKQSLDVTEALKYPGVVSSHSWSTPDAYPRITAAKGFLAPYAGDSTGFVEKWKQVLAWANPQAYWGFGFGADINGLGAQGDPRANAASNPVRYPFTGMGGVKVYQQVSGQRTYDINTDGVAHYGLYADWIEDLRVQAGSKIVADLQRGPEAYLQMWERVYGAQPDACTNPGLKRTAASFHRIRRGTSWWNVVLKAGQPHRRLDKQFSYCAQGGKTVRVSFNAAGRVTAVKG